MASIKTVNVVEMDTYDASITSLRSFVDDEGGRIEAKAHYSKLVYESLIAEFETDDPTLTTRLNIAIEDCVFKTGDYQVMLVYSQS
jgi:hypothetical protein